MAAPTVPGDMAPIEKIMTLSKSEFANSIRAFAGETAAQSASGGGPVVIPMASGEAVISFTPIEGFSFGGLVPMPRARVEISFSGGDKAAAAEFMRRFDIAFQRGGG